MNTSPLNLAQEWDVIIIGTGMGGATAGYKLANAGLKVLFLEKGGDVQSATSEDALENPESRIKGGWWPEPISQLKSDSRCDRFYASIGCAMGGSSIHYAAALERMEASDFESISTPSQTVAAWPVSFKEFLPYYEAAETLYGLNNDNDERWLARISEWDRAFLTSMREAGLKPERLKVAMKLDQECTECVGVVCPRKCKADARVTCLNTALMQGNCAILTNCDVQTLVADKAHVQYVNATHQGATIKLHAKQIILAAGAMHSPQILLKSRNEFWPNGLANTSDQVGRNLMFHGLDMYAVWAPKKLNRKSVQKKSLSIRDFYVHEGVRLGYIQSMGLTAGRGNIAGFLKDTLRRRGIKNELVLSLLTKIPSHIAAWALGEASIFAAQIEDDPDPNNRIKVDPNEPNGACFSYTITDDLRQRADKLRKSFAKNIGSWRLMGIMPTLEINTGHPSGTCRFGNDPLTSVLDINCRCHDIRNLYVVDSSFMPRSAAINPSLTIAANALRVADKIITTSELNA
jgi:choline dehydrogenase-like flavoprotein